MIAIINFVNWATKGTQFFLPFGQIFFKTKNTLNALPLSTYLDDLGASHSGFWVVF